MGWPAPLHQRSLMAKRELTADEVLAKVGVEREPLGTVADTVIKNELAAEGAEERNRAREARSVMLTDEPAPEPEAPVLQPPTEAGAPNPWEVMARVATALEALVARSSGGSQDSTAIEKLTTALERMTSAQIQSSDKSIEEARRAFRPSNMVNPGVSVFNRRGDRDFPKPPLKCMVMMPWLAEHEALTREEVELLNLLEAGEYTIKRTDRSKIVISVQMRYNVDGKTPSAMLISHETAFNNDNFRMMPAIADWLRDALKQHDRTIAQQAAAILTDEEEEALIEAGELTVSL